jgi:hypothetical protein
MVRRTAWLLAIAGAIPFAAMTLALLGTDNHVRIPAIAALVTYTAVILSFLGGIEWGLAVQDPLPGPAPREKDRLRAMALFISAAPSLAAWGVFWLPSPHWQLGTSLALFVLVWAADLALSRQGLVPSWFVDLRTAITAVVAVILGIALCLL